MGWNSELFCTITFHKETFNSKYEVIDKIDEYERCVQNAKEHIRDLVIMTEPQKFCPENYDPIIWIRNDFKDYMELIEEYTIELYKLNRLLELWDTCHDKNGLAIEPPKEIHYDSAFFRGDFVKSVNRPNVNNIL